MPDIRLLTEQELRRVITLDDAVIDCIEQAFIALAHGDVAMPPVLRLDIPTHNGEVDVKTAHIPGQDSFAIKISPGFFDNPARGLPSVNGLMNLFSAHTGLLEAVFFDNGYLTDLRTAAAGAVAARHLARPDASHAVIFGAGMQARLQLQALCCVRPITSAEIWARKPDQAASCARQIQDMTGIATTPVTDRAKAAARADIIVTTTPARIPILQAGWVRPGTHITAMGSDAEYKNEIDPALIAQADCYVADRLAQCRVQGELHHAIKSGVLPADAPLAELGQIIRTRMEDNTAATVTASASPTTHPAGRQHEHDITLCDLTGTGIQDTAIANLAYRRCIAANAGQILTSQ